MPEHDRAEMRQFGVRFDPTQSEIVEQAARIKNISVAKFARDATIVRAIHVVNAEGDADTHLHRLALKAATAVRHGWIATGAGRPSTRDLELLPPEELEDLPPEEVKAMTQHEIAQFIEALETSGTVFVDILLKHLKSDSPTSYKPRYGPTDLEKIRLSESPDPAPEGEL